MQTTDHVNTVETQEILSCKSCLMILVGEKKRFFEISTFYYEKFAIDFRKKFSIFFIIKLLFIFY